MFTQFLIVRIFIESHSERHIDQLFLIIPTSIFAVVKMKTFVQLGDIIMLVEIGTFKNSLKSENHFCNESSNMMLVKFGDNSMKNKMLFHARIVRQSFALQKKKMRSKSNE